MSLFTDLPMEYIDLPDSELCLLSDAGFDADRLLDRLIDEIPWYSRSITLWGRTYQQPRLMAWYADDGLGYTYSGETLEAMPWTPLLTSTRRRVEEVTGEAFNSVLLNYYRDERDSMGMHSDDEPELGDRPVIASLSLGAERPFVMQHKTRKELKSQRFTLPSGSLLLMRGETQRHWKHGIHKQARPCGPRVNLTFRQILRAGEAGSRR